MNNNSILNKQFLSAKKLIYLCVILMSAFLGISFSLLAEQPDKHIKATTLLYPPYEYLEDGQPTGIAIDIINEAFNRMGDYRVQFSFFPWGRSVHETKVGRQDMLFNAGVNQERKEWGSYVKTTLVEQRYVLFALADSQFSVNSNIDNVEELVFGTKLHYIYGTGVLRNALDNQHFKRVVKVRSISQNVQMLLKGRIDLFVGDYLPVMYHLTKNCLIDSVRVVKETNTNNELVVLNWPTYLLISKKSSFFPQLNRLNNVMAEMKDLGVFEELAAPYYESIVSPVKPSGCKDQ